MCQILFVCLNIKNSQRELDVVTYTFCNLSTQEEGAGPHTYQK